MTDVVLLHGWSATGKSMGALTAFLRGAGFNPVDVFVGDYESLYDDVSIEDVSRRMEAVVRDKMAAGHLQAPFHLIVHSTGALVARTWLSRFYLGKPSPVSNFLMLAPANYGSRWAKLGRSLIGRITKGSLKRGLQSGATMLTELEFAADMHWRLTRRDLLSAPGDPPGAVYSANGCRPFVIVGLHPQEPLPAFITEHGSDGTVRTAAANMNVRGMTIDFSANPTNPVRTEWTRRAPEAMPYLVLPDRDHGAILEPDKGFAHEADLRAILGAEIRAALSVTEPTAYAAIAARWTEIYNTRTRPGALDSPAGKAIRDSVRWPKAIFTDDADRAKYFHEHYLLNTRVTDVEGEPIEDYFLSFGSRREDAATFTERAPIPPDEDRFHMKALNNVHVNSQSGARRALYIDRMALVTAQPGGVYKQVTGATPHELWMSLTIAPKGDLISYFPAGKDGPRASVRLHVERDDADARWLKRRQTHFVDIIAPRTIDPRVFRLTQDA